MTTKQKSNLAKTALTMLSSKIPLKMNYFLSSDCNKVDKYSKVPRKIYNECGTSCCLVGFGPLALQKGLPMVNAPDSWHKFSHENYGLSDDKNSDTWDFVFSSFWSNDKQQTAIRALMAMREEIPRGWDYEDQYFKPQTLKALRKALNKFVA